MVIMTEIYQKLVDYFGNQTKTADKLKVKQPSVSAWVVGKAQMSAVSAKRAEKLTNGKFRAIDLCPRLAEIEMMDTSEEAE